MVRLLPYESYIMGRMPGKHIYPVKQKVLNQFLALIASPQISVLSFQIAYSALNFLLLNRHLRQFDSFNNFYSDLESDVTITKY